MSFWGAHEFRRNPKNRPPKKIPHEDCTAGIRVSDPIDLTRLLRDPWSLELFEILMTQTFKYDMVDTSP